MIYKSEDFVYYFHDKLITTTKNAIAADCAPDCVEMEGAAVAHVAAKYGVPCLSLIHI